MTLGRASIALCPSRTDAVDLSILLATAFVR